MTKQYGKKNYGSALRMSESPLIQQTEEFIENVVLKDQPSTPAQTPATVAPAATQAPQTVRTTTPAQAPQVAPDLSNITKVVQTRIPLSTYEKLNRLKYFLNEGKKSIGEILIDAINEYLEKRNL